MATGWGGGVERFYPSDSHVLCEVPQDFERQQRRDGECGGGRESGVCGCVCVCWRGGVYPGDSHVLYEVPQDFERP